MFHSQLRKLLHQ